jgi:hypothetical protein
MYQAVPVHGFSATADISKLLLSDRLRSVQVVKKRGFRNVSISSFGYPRKLLL